MLKFEEVNTAELNGKVTDFWIGVGVGIAIGGVLT